MLTTIKLSNFTASHIDGFLKSERMINKRLSLSFKKLSPIFKIEVISYCIANEVAREAPSKPRCLEMRLFYCITNTSSTAIPSLAFGCKADCLFCSCKQECCDNFAFGLNGFIGIPI